MAYTPDQIKEIASRPIFLVDVVSEFSAEAGREQGLVERRREELDHLDNLRNSSISHVINDKHAEEVLKESPGYIAEHSALSEKCKKAAQTVVDVLKKAQ